MSTRRWIAHRTCVCGPQADPGRCAQQKARERADGWGRTLALRLCECAHASGIHSATVCSICRTGRCADGVRAAGATGRIPSCSLNMNVRRVASGMRACCDVRAPSSLRRVSSVRLLVRAQTPVDSQCPPQAASSADFLAPQRSVVAATHWALRTMPARDLGDGAIWCQRHRRRDGGACASTNRPTAGRRLEGEPPRSSEQARRKLGRSALMKPKLPVLWVSGASSRSADAHAGGWVVSAHNPVSRSAAQQTPLMLDDGRHERAPPSPPPLLGRARGD